MRLRHAVKAGLCAAVALFGGAAWAQMPGGAHMQGPEGMAPMRGFERLHKELSRNAQQEELGKQAQTAQREAFKALRAMDAEARAQLRVEIDKPGVDLK